MGTSPVCIAFALEKILTSLHGFWNDVQVEGLSSAERGLEAVKASTVDELAVWTKGLQSTIAR